MPLRAVTGSFVWTGGEIYAPVHLASSASGTIGAGPLKPLHARITVDGTLALGNIGAAGGTLVLRSGSTFGGAGGRRRDRPLSRR